MQIPRETRDKLRRYFMNADPFLWNVLKEKNRKKRLKELQRLGFLTDYAEGGNPIYSRINQDLPVEIGIEGILERIVVPRVLALFPPDVLQYFRRCWEQGQIPPLEYLKRNKLYRSHHLTGSEVREGWAPPLVSGYKEAAFIFVQIDTQHDFVERWTVFAELWFEEIEPLPGPIQGTSRKQAGNAGHHYR